MYTVKLVMLSIQFESFLIIFINRYCSYPICH